MKKSISTEDTKTFAKELAIKLLEKPSKTAGALVISLEGELGSGKTTFAQGFAEALGVQEQVLSPTFNIIKSYDVPGNAPFQHIYHIDCYRLQDAKEIVSLGWKDMVSNKKNIILVEWAERVKDVLPEDQMVITFSYNGKEGRDITLQ